MAEPKFIIFSSFSLFSKIEIIWTFHSRTPNYRIKMRKTDYLTERMWNRNEKKESERKNKKKTNKNKAYGVTIHPTSPPNTNIAFKINMQNDYLLHTLNRCWKSLFCRLNKDFMYLTIFTASQQTMFWCVLFYLLFSLVLSLFVLFEVFVFFFSFLFSLCCLRIIRGLSMAQKRENNCRKQRTPFCV